MMYMVFFKFMLLGYEFSFYNQILKLIPPTLIDISLQNVLFSVETINEAFEAIYSSGPSCSKHH